MASSSILRPEHIAEPEHVRTVPLRVGASTQYCIHVRSAILGHVTFWAERDPDDGRYWRLIPDGIVPWVEPVASGLHLLADAVAAALANVRESDRVAVRVHGVTYAALGLPEPEPERAHDQPNGRCTGYRVAAGSVSRCECGHGRGSFCH